MARYALMLNAGPEEVGTAGNGFQYALKLDDHDHDVSVYLDGVATRWPGKLQSRSGHPVNEYFSELQDRGLVEGACRFCANAFDGTRGCEEAGVELLGDGDGHGPDVGRLASDGHQLLTIG